MSTPAQLPDAVWRGIAERTSDGVFVTDPDHVIRWANPAACEMLGRTLESLVGTNGLELLADRDREEPEVHESFQRLMSGARLQTVRTLRAADGSTRVVEISVAPLDDGLAVSVTRDVTAKRAAGERLARSEAGFRALIDRSPDGIVVHHRGRAVYVNDAMRELLGFPPGAPMLDVSVIDFVHPDDRPQVVDRLRRLQAGDVTVPFAEERLIRRDGTVVICNIGAVTVEFEGVPCVVAIARDVTEQRRLQARLVEADRMVSLGTLSAGIAHEINNPLTYLILHVDAVAAAAQRLAPMLEGDARQLLERLIGSISIVQDGAARVRDIVRDLRVFSRAADDARTPLDLRPAVERALSITGHELRQRATLVTRLDEVPAVLASDGRLTQVFVNLLANASHAVGPGDPERQRIEVATWTEDGAAKVSVRDTGHGIAPELLPRIFEPFFTTKPVGEGSGLGLAIVHGIVTAIGGKVEVHSVVGEGTTVVVTLPAHVRST